MRRGHMDGDLAKFYRYFGIVRDGLANPVPGTLVRSAFGCDLSTVTDPRELYDSTSSAHRSFSKFGHRKDMRCAARCRRSRRAMARMPFPSASWLHLTMAFDVLLPVGMS